MAKKATRSAPAKTAPSTPKPQKSRARTTVPASNEAEIVTGDAGQNNSVHHSSGAEPAKNKAKAAGRKNPSIILPAHSSDAALPASVGDLSADAANPRAISDESAAALRKSLKRFGDLAGIVWNRRTSELVTGHQRVSQLREEYPDAVIEFDAAGRGVLRAGEETFSVRVVDWSKEKQRLANVTANNTKLQGRFTDDLSAYLLEVSAELEANLPGAVDELLAVDLMAASLDADAKKAADAKVADKYQIIVDCEDEAAQKELYEYLCEDGHTCKLLTI